MKQKLVLIATASVALILHSPAQDAADPFATGGADDDPFGGGPAPARRVVKHNSETAPIPTNLSIRYEEFSLDLATAATLMRNGTSDPALYEALVGMLKDKKAVQESLLIIRMKPGTRGKTESIGETIYPTEWDPAEIPNSIGVKIAPPVGADGNSTGGPPNLDALDKAQALNDLPFFVTPATPTAFETRNVGMTFEVEAIQNSDGLIDLNIAPEHVTMVGNSEWGQGVSKVPMPEFECQKISTSILVIPGVPSLLGTINRPGASKVNADSATRIWFAFATASPVK